jgi:predicted amidophosphoribosyltransferase
MSEQPSSSSPATFRAASAAMMCPTCRAAWRGAVMCPRCGTDLTALMRVAVRAWELRQATRAALCAGDRATEALALARAACQLHTTPYGQRLLALALLVNGHMAEAYAVLEQVLQAQPPPFPLPLGEG